MKIQALAFIMIIITAYSCNEAPENKNKATPQQEEINETPEVLDENSDYKLSSLSKRYDTDLILKLYDEAIEKNSKLKQLNDGINKISLTKNDSLKEYSKFSQTNKKYWTTANRYINKLQDSILKKSTLEIFNALESKYETKMSDYEQKLTDINKKTVSLNDQLILMKLLITAPMIKNYQINKIPEIKTLENIIDEYDRLIKETREYTKTVN